MPLFDIMPILLTIDTAGETASVALSNDKDVIASRVSTDQKNHASFIQAAIQDIIQTTGIAINNIDAVSVVNGPGSYTGLRVGLASAKGIAYATSKPLILLNTLTVMALAAIEKFNLTDALYCPMIDARRNEVFTAVYDSALNIILPPQPIVIEKDSYKNFLEEQKVVFFGSGHNKCGKVISHENAVFADVPYSVFHITSLTSQAYMESDFSDIAYSEPFYTKEFYSTG